MDRKITTLFLTIGSVLMCCRTALAAEYFVHPAQGENVNAEDLRGITSLVRTSVAATGEDTVVNDEFIADYSLQPKLLRLGDNYILTIEKKRGSETLYARQIKAASLDQLDIATRRVTVATLDAPPGSNDFMVVPSGNGRPIASAPSVSGATQQPPVAETGVATDAATPAAGVTQAQDPRLYKMYQTFRYWSIGVGPFVSNELDADNVMYNLSVGHIWEIHPQASVKALGEVALGSGDEDASFYNFGVGASYAFMQRYERGSPYVTADLGYGFAESVREQDATGFSFGTGIGYQFFRQSDANLDVLLRYAVISDDVGGGGYPSIFGARLAVNF